MNFNLYSAEDFAANESFIAYYLQTDSEAVTFWQNWISLHPEKLDEIYKAELLLAKLHLQLSDMELNNAFKKFDDFIDGKKAEPIAKPRFAKKIFSYSRIAIAASLLIICSATIYLFNKTTYKEDTLTYYNGYGKTAIIVLEDGTKISLNSNSSLKYPKHFGKLKREVSLIGEGFFEVAKDKKRPFTVKTAQLQTTVLGTKFNVSAYKNVKQVTVALVEGSVAVELANKKQQTILKPNQMAWLSDASNQIETTSFDAKKINAWQTGTIIFENASFEDIAIKLYNAYGVSIINKTGNSDWKYSGNFTKTDYLSIIKNICFAKRINYEINNKTITLKP